MNIAKVLNGLAADIYNTNVGIGWYSDRKTGERIDRNVGEMLALIHSEVSEALEGHRKGLMDTHLTERPMIEVELADTLIRVFDLAGYLGLDIGGAFVAKREYNAVRQDHKLETRNAEGGKAF
jgi:hypothetical protein